MSTQVVPFVSSFKKKKNTKSQTGCWWFIPVILILGKLRLGGSQFDVSKDKKLVRPHLNQ
jgi:hypothetical protein